MKISSIPSAVNYAVTQTARTVHTLAADPSAVKEAIQVATNIFAAIDLYFIGTIQERKLTQAMQGTVDWIDFYSTFNDVIFWINPFSKETLDEAALGDSLRSALCDPTKNKKLVEKQEKKAASIVQEVLKTEKFYSKSEVREALALSLEKNGYKPQTAKEIAAKIEIRQKARPITLLFSKACLTTVDLLGNVLTLQKWGVADLSKLTAKIGSQSRVFLFVIDLGAETVLGTIASAALIVLFSEAAYRAILQAVIIYQNADPKQKEEAHKGLQKALLEMLSNGLDLSSTAAPLLFTLNPPAVVALAIVARGTALICILGHF